MGLPGADTPLDGVGSASVRLADVLPALRSMFGAAVRDHIPGEIEVLGLRLVDGDGLDVPFEDVVLIGGFRVVDGASGEGDGGT